jgi:hypothetical protein
MALYVFVLASGQVTGTVRDFAFDPATRQSGQDGYMAPAKGRWAQLVDEPTAFDPRHQTRSRSVPSNVPSGAVTVSYGVASRPTATVKAELTAQAKVRAEQIRASYLTPGYGKALEYREKVDEVRRYEADGAPDAADYPMLKAEADGRAITLGAAHALIKATYEQWCAINKAVLTAESAGAKAIADAADGAVAVAAFDAITWPPSA